MVQETTCPPVVLLLPSESVTISLIMLPAAKFICQATLQKYNFSDIGRAVTSGTHWFSLVVHRRMVPALFGMTTKLNGAAVPFQTMVFYR